jgi:hypothetical protein
MGVSSLDGFALSADARSLNKVRLYYTFSLYFVSNHVLAYVFYYIKNGVEYKRSMQNQPDETSWKKASRLTLPFRRAASGSSGNYTCLALGLKERIETNFDIQVLGRHFDIKFISQLSNYQR